MSRTIRRKNGCHHFTPSSNLLNPIWINEQKEVDGIWYVGCYERVYKTREIVLNWYSIEEYIENERKSYHERWGKYEHRDKKVLRHYSKSVKHYYNRAGRANKRKQCYDLMKDPEADFLLETAYQKGIVWIFD